MLVVPLRSCADTFELRPRCAEDRLGAECSPHATTNINMMRLNAGQTHRCAVANGVSTSRSSMEPGLPYPSCYHLGRLVRSPTFHAACMIVAGR